MQGVFQTNDDMGGTWSGIGHGLSEDVAISSAVGYVTSSRYVVKEQAEAQISETTKRIFFFIDGYYWYECILEKKNPKDGAPSSFVASFVYFARTQTELQQKLEKEEKKERIPICFTQFKRELEGKKEEPAENNFQIKRSD